MIALAKERRQETNFPDRTIKVKAGVGEQGSTFLMMLKKCSLKANKQWERTGLVREGSCRENQYHPEIK